MKNTTLLAAVIVLLASAQVATAQFVTFNNRADFLAALSSTLIDDDLNRYAPNDIDFENTSVNTVSAGNPLMGFDVSHVGDEITTQFVNGSLTNMTNTGNPTPDMQFLLDLAGVTGAFGSTSNVADSATITVQTAGVNAFGFDTFGFNDQGQSFLVDPGTLGVEMGVTTTVMDSLGNSENITVAASDPFFGVVAFTPGAQLSTIAFSANTTFATSGTEFIAIDNFVGGTSSIPEPGTIALALIGACGFAAVRMRRRLG